MVSPNLRVVQPKSAPEREPGHSGRGVDPERGCERKRLSFVVEIGERRAGLDASGASRGIDADRSHRGEIDEKPAVADRRAGDVVAAAADRDEQLLVSRQPERMDDIGGAAAARDQPRTPVDHGVPDRSRRFVAVLAGQRHFAAQPAAEGCEGLLGNGLGSIDGAYRQIVHGRLPAGGKPVKSRRAGGASHIVAPDERSHFTASCLTASSRTESKPV